MTLARGRVSNRDAMPRPNPTRDPWWPRLPFWCVLCDRGHLYIVSVGVTVQATSRVNHHTKREHFRQVWPPGLCDEHYKSALRGLRGREDLLDEVKRQRAYWERLVRREREGEP